MTQAQGTVDRTAILPLALMIGAILVGNMIVLGFGFPDDDDVAFNPLTSTSTSTTSPSTTVPATTVPTVTLPPTTIPPVATTTPTTSPPVTFTPTTVPASCGTGTASAVVSATAPEGNDEDDPTQWTVTVATSVTNSHPDPIVVPELSIGLVYETAEGGSETRAANVPTSGVTIGPGSSGSFPPVTFTFDQAPSTTTSGQTQLAAFSWHPVGRPECAAG